MSNAPSRNPAGNDTITGLLNFALLKFLQSVDGCLPAKVIAYDPGTNRAQVQPLIVQVTTGNEQVARAQIASVPVARWGAGGFLLYFPVTSGDKGWLIANDRDISIYKQTGGQSPPNTNRLHSFEDGWFLPDTALRDVTLADPGKCCIQSYDGTTSITMGGGVITMSTTVTGILKGNGTAISAAVANTDYQGALTLTTTGSTGAATLTGATLNIPQYSGGGGSGTVNSGTANQIAFYSATGTAVSGDGNITDNGAIITHALPTNLTGAGASSQPSLYLNNTLFTGGTGTNNFPNSFWQPASGATAVTTWSTAGTVFGANAPTGFTGNFLDFRLNGASAAGAAFTVAFNGNTTIGGTVTTGGAITAGAGITAKSVISNGTKFTATGCSNTTTVGGATAGKYSSGTTGTCAVVVTLPAATNGWNCAANDLTTNSDIQTQTASSTTSATISGTTVSGDVISFSCMGY